MLILEQWPRQIAPAAGGTLASNFRVLRLDQPAGQPSQLSWTTPVLGACLASHGARLPRPAQLLLPTSFHSTASSAFLSALVVSCQVRVPRTGPGPAGTWRLMHRAGRR